MSKDKKQEAGSFWDNYRVSVPLVIVLIIVGFVIFLVVLETSNNPSSSSGSSNSEGNSFGQNCRYEDIPYQEQESYYVTLNYNVFDINLKEDADGFDYVLRGSYSLQNLDTDEGGYFTAYFAFVQGGNRQYTDQETIYLQPGQVGKVYFTWEGAKLFGGSIGYGLPIKVNAPTVTKYRTITKYRTEKICD